MAVKLFDELLAKEVTRKEFLVHVGVLFLLVTGITSLVKTLADPQLTKRSTQPVSEGFGSGPYGG